MRKLNRDGFVLSYLSAISEEDYNSSLTDRNQLKLEAMLRRAVSEKKPSELPPCSLGVGDRIGKAEWQPYYSHGSIFVDRSSFYSLLQRIKMYVASVLVADEDITAEAVLWTYMSTGVYLHGKLISETEHPVYKPIQSVKCTLNLRKGRNELVFLLIFLVDVKLNLRWDLLLLIRLKLIILHLHVNEDYYNSIVLILI